MLAIGPLLRAALGDSYSVIFGLLAALVFMFLEVKVSALVAPRFGGEWVSREQQISSLLADQLATPLWRDIALRVLTFIALLAGFLLIITPFDQVVNSPAGRENLLLYIAVAIFGGGTQGLLLRRRLSGAVVVSDEPPNGEVRARLRRILPRYYAAWAVGITVGMLVAWQFTDQSTLVFTAASLVVLQIFLVVLLSGTPIRSIFASQTGSSFRSLLPVSVLFWGVPMALFVSGSRIVDAHKFPNTVSEAVLALVIALSVTAFSGGALGAMIYWLIRLNDARRQGAV